MCTAERNEQTVQSGIFGSARSGWWVVSFAGRAEAMEALVVLTVRRVPFSEAFVFPFSDGRSERGQDRAVGSGCGESDAQCGECEGLERDPQVDD